MTIDRICVIGGGTIGSLLAGHLASCCDVTVLVRRDEHAAALNERGLRITGKSDLHAELAAVTDPRRVREPDVVIVAVKATQLRDVTAMLRGRFQHAVMMTVQNGLGAEEMIQGAGPWRLISAVTFMSGIRHGDEHVEYELDTSTWLGPYAGTSTPLELADALGAVIERSGLEAQVFADVRPAQWSKLVFNAAVNGVAALTDLPHVAGFAETEHVEDLGNLVRGLIDEGKAVARAAGVELHEDPWEMNVRAVRRGESDAADGAYAHVPSMLEDILARRPTEVDFISGALVREASRYGVDVPLNAAIWRLIRAREASWQPRELVAMQGAHR